MGIHPEDGTAFVSECQLESDLQLSFSEEYVPTSSERMLLYRELDGLEKEEDVDRFRQRMSDRFGPIPPEGEELIKVVTLRRWGRHFGAERIILKLGRMRLFFVSRDDSPFYQSHAFDQIIAFASANAHRCRLEEQNHHRSLLVSDVKSVEEAVRLLEQTSQIMTD